MPNSSVSDFTRYINKANVNNVKQIRIWKQKFIDFLGKANLTSRYFDF
ncbi:hypothetical protein E5E38_07960 [Helicobacter pylori]|nr:hypothetical protein E5E38_07960 [Helicobacter pylori]